MDASTEQPAPPRRRWFRFSLRTLLILVTLLSVPLEWVAWKRGQERAAISWVEKMGGYVVYEYRYKLDNRNWWEESTDKWFRERVRGVCLRNTPVSDLSPLAELKHLEGLNLYSAGVKDLSPLAELTKLEILTLSYTQVSDLSPLAELKNLEQLFLINTQVSDLSPLVELKNLYHLRLDNTQVSDEQVQELRQALPNCSIDYTTVSPPPP
jgi:hypothetical protein